MRGSDSSSCLPASQCSLRRLASPLSQVLSLKHKVVAQMEEIVPKHCIIATNTSTLPIAHIAQHAKRPENIVGMHYFSPAEVMQLLEVIPHAKTSEAVCAAAVDVGIRQGKTVISVKDVPGADASSHAFILATLIAP